jgi:hypothetical protein
MKVVYYHITPETNLPDITEMKPFLAVLVIELHPATEWRESVSKWLVNSGCQYLMSWGEDRAAWEEAVDLANIAQFNSGEIPNDEMVLTVEHGDDAPELFFREVKTTATQDCIDFDNTLIIHISKLDKEEELLSLYSNA